MKKIFYGSCATKMLLMAVTAVSLVSCGDKNNGGTPSQQPPTPPTPVENYDTVDYDKLTLTWSDEFDGTAVDMTKWNYRAEGTERGKKNSNGTYSGNGAFSAIVSRSTISLDGQGHCSIKVLRVDDDHYLVGQLGTDKIFSQKYGYFECRAMMNKQLGPHVAFWLQSATMGSKPEANDPGTYGTEIDIFEYHRKDPNTVHFNLHWNGYGTYHQTTGSKYNYEAIKEGWHTFGLRWMNNKYIFYVDGKKIWETNKAVSQIAEYLILSTELTGWGGAPAGVTYPDEVLFDYVRVYKFK